MGSAHLVTPTEARLVITVRSGEGAAACCRNDVMEAVEKTWRGGMSAHMSVQALPSVRPLGMELPFTHRTQALDHAKHS